jgi:hypothetical protein
VATGVHACGHAHTYMLWTVSKIYSKLSDERDFKCHLMKYAFKETFTYVQEERVIFVFTVDQSPHHQHSPGSVTSPSALSWFSHLTISSLLVQSPHHQLSPGSVTSPSALSWFSHLTISSLLVQSPHHQHSPGHTCGIVIMTLRLSTVSLTHTLWIVDAHVFPDQDHYYPYHH